MNATETKSEEMVGIGESDKYVYATCCECGVESGSQYKVSGSRFQSSEDYTRLNSRCAPCQYEHDKKNNTHTYGGMCWCGKHGMED